MTARRGAPIFLLGVPRSGTTLLRMMLDSHPDIMCGPEAPWIAGRKAGDPSLRGLIEFVVGDRWGAVSGFQGVDEAQVYAAAAELLDRLLGAAARARGKSRWAEKTPENVAAVAFLARLFPDAHFIHLVRDGRDVALSTAGATWDRLAFGGGLVRNTYANALRRWRDWNRLCREELARSGVRTSLVRYEDLVLDPPATMRRILSFVEADWSDAVLRPHAGEHDVVDPGGEGIRSFVARDGVHADRRERWRGELGWWRRRVTRRIAEADLAEWGYGPTA